MHIKKIDHLYYEKYVRNYKIKINYPILLRTFSSQNIQPSPLIDRRNRNWIKITESKKKK